MSAIRYHLPRVLDLDDAEEYGIGNFHIRIFKGIHSLGDMSLGMLMRRIDEPPH